MKVIPVTAVLLASAVYLTGCGQNADKQAQTTDTAEADTPSADANDDTAETGTVKETFGTFASKDLDGNDVTQDIFKDAKVTMINVWGTFCGPCIKEMPDLAELSTEYKDKDLQIIGIPLDVIDGKNEDAARDIVAETGADYTHVLPDASSTILGRVQVVPTTIFVNQDGDILNVYTGARSKSQWTEIMDAELA
ncbi:MAG: TlpA disulfide reductase family protein [Lachnospiraceae bacterium]|nr:TlpA disulfide reductase family protein [Lachnospiraceae bacterium]